LSGCLSYCNVFSIVLNNLFELIYTVVITFITLFSIFLVFDILHSLVLIAFLVVHQRWILSVLNISVSLDRVCDQAVDGVCEEHRFGFIE
jgi:hypothetical protein